MAESADAAHVGAPVRPVPDRSYSKTTRNMCITVGSNAAISNGIPALRAGRRKGRKERRGDGIPE
jgi:hypothetical protein